MQPDSYGTNVNVTQINDNMVSYTQANASARVDMTYKVPRDMDLYVNCRGNNIHKIALLIDGTEVAYDRYQGQLFHVGKMKAGQLVDLQFELNDGKDQNGELYCYPMEFVESQFNTFYNVLKDNSMKITDFKDTKIEGKISVKEDGVFMTSLPYDEGWHVFVNGKETETVSILDSFLGAKLSQGDYDIKLVYRCPGLREGFILTVIGTLCFVLICMLERNVKQRRRIKYKQIDIKEDKGNGEE